MKRNELNGDDLDRSESDDRLVQEPLKSETHT